MLTGGTPVPRGMGILPMRCLSLKPDVCATRSRLNRVILLTAIRLRRPLGLGPLGPSDLTPAYSSLTPCFSAGWAGSRTIFEGKNTPIPPALKHGANEKLTGL